MKDLGAIAKNAGLRGYSTLRKADLIETLKDNSILSEDIFDVHEPTQNQNKICFKIQKRASALRRFTIEYKIEGRDGYVPKTFLQATKAWLQKWFYLWTEFDLTWSLKVCIFQIPMGNPPKYRYWIEEDQTWPVCLGWIPMDQCISTATGYPCLTNPSGTISHN